MEKPLVLFTIVFVVAVIAGIVVKYSVKQEIVTDEESGKQFIKTRILKASK